MEKVKKHFPIRRGLFRKETGSVKAVDGVSLRLYPKETFGLVGKSGCGKSTLGRMIVKLLELTEGDIRYQGKNIFHGTRAEAMEFTRNVQMIFQDPFASLNPRQQIQRIIEEPLLIHEKLEKDERTHRARQLLERVDLTQSHVTRFPHEFSGGQRQRIGIARALALQPRLIVCDEPVSALDVSVQAQIINLLEDVQAEFHMSYLFISHDLSVVRHISHRVGVMYLGILVEVGETKELFEDPRHPYTQELLSSILVMHPRDRGKRRIFSRNMPSPGHPPFGCKFHTRCPYAEERCR